MIDWEGIALGVLAAVVVGILIWQYIEWRIGALTGWFVKMTRLSTELAVDVVRGSLDHVDQLDQHVTALVDEIVRARVDEAMRRFYNGEVLVEPANAAPTEDTPF